MTSKSSPPDISPHGSPIERVLDRLAVLIFRRAELIFLLAAAIFLLSLHYTRYLPLKSSVFDLLPADDPLVTAYREVEAILTPADFAAVLLILEDPPDSSEEREKVLFSAAERLARELDDPEIRRVSYRVGEGVEIPRELLLFYQLDSKALGRLREIAQEVVSLFPPLEKGSLQEVSVFARVEELRKLLENPLETDVQELLTDLRDLRSDVHAVTKLIAHLKYLPRLRALLDEAAGIISELLDRPPPKAQPLLSPDRTKLLVQIWPRRPSYTGVAYSHKLTRIIEGAVARARLSELGVRAGITGNYVAVSQGQRLIQQDLTRTTFISSAGVFVILLFSLGSILGVIVTLIPLLVSAFLTIAWAKFSVGGFNLITVFLPALVLGLGVDYSLHLISRIMEEIRNGESFPEALRIAIRTKGGASLGAALTTGLAFSCLLLARSLGLKEMGVIMALGIFIALVISLLVGPATLVLLYRASGERFRPRGLGYERRLFHPYRLLLNNRWAVIVLTVLLTGAVSYQASQVSFRFVPQELSPTTEAQKVASEAFRAFSGEVSFKNDFLVFAPGSRELDKISAELRAHPGIGTVHSLRDLLPSELLRGEVTFQEIPLQPLDVLLSLLEENVDRWTERIREARELAVLLAQGELFTAILGAGEVASELSGLVNGLLNLSTLMATYDPVSLEADTRALRGDYGVIEKFLRHLQALPPEGELLQRIVEVLPEDLKAYYSTPEGKFVLHVGMKPGYLEGERLDEFIGWLEEQGFDYFGFPEVRLRLKHYMQRDFAVSTSLAAGLILAVLFLNFRSFKVGVVALVPLVVGYVWMLAGMKFLGIDFNFINISISPLLIGLGVDAGIHMAHRILEEGRNSAAVARGAASSAMPVVAAALTTMVVFGALLWANTPGLRVLGTCALLGLGFSLVGSLLFVPAALVRVERSGRGG
jgi:hypothetical protein